MQTAGVQGINIPYNMHNGDAWDCTQRHRQLPATFHPRPLKLVNLTVWSPWAGILVNFRHTHIYTQRVGVGADSFTAQPYWLATPENRREI